MDTAVSVTWRAMKWGKKQLDEINKNVTKLNETRIPGVEDVATRMEEQLKLAAALDQIAQGGASHDLFQGMVWEGSVIEAFFETSSTTVRGFHVEARAFLYLIEKATVIKP
jgi:hypothetical protein